MNNDKNNFFLHQLVENIAERLPDHHAILYHNKYTTYRDLNKIANKVAHYILEKNLSFETPIPILMQDQFFYVVSILAILKSGHCFTPLSPSAPVERLQLILDQLDCPFIFTDKESLCLLSDEKKQLICLNEITDKLSHSDKNPHCQIQLNKLAYLIFTSGSTGIPKGVLMEHAGPANIIQTMSALSMLQPNEYFVQNVNFSFDPHVWTLFWPLSLGATVILLNEQEQHDPERLAKIICDYKIHVIHSGVSLTKALLKTQLFPLCHTLTQIIGGGEAWPFSILAELHQIHQRCELINVYGPTETCVHVSTWSSKKDKLGISQEIPIGKSISNCTIHILDEQLRPVAQNESGQIYIAGTGLARGYYRDEIRTSQKFITTLAMPNVRLYQSGDLGIFNENNDIEFLGRIDDQVQVRGYRVELGEIETALLKSGFVSQAAVIANVINHQSYVHAFVVLASCYSDKAESLHNIKQYLLRYLPQYMLPKQINIVDSLPLTISGKVNKTALRELISPQLLYHDPLPESDYKSQIKKIWEKILQIQQIHDYDDFFQIGGDSLSALDIVANINKVYGIEIPVIEIFNHPTLSTFSNIVAEQSMSQAADKNKKIVDVHYNELEFSYNQLRLLKLSSSDKAINNAISPFKLTGQLDIDTLKEAFNAVVDRHELLRCNISAGTKIKFILHNCVNNNFEYHDFTNTAQPMETVKTYMNTVLKTSFNHEHEPFFKGILIKCSKSEHILLLYINHLIVDAYSAQLITSELFTVYTNSVNKSLNLLPISNPFRNYLQAEREFYQSSRRAEQLHYWINKLASKPRVLRFGNLTEKENDMSAGYAMITIELSDAFYVRQIAHENKITLFNVLLCVFTLALHQTFKQSEFVVGFTYSLRDKYEYQNMVGPLSNKLLLPLDFSRSTSFGELLKNISNQLIDIYNNADIQLETIVEAVKEIERESYNDLYNILFDYERRSFIRKTVKNLNIESLPMPNYAVVKRHLSTRVIDNDATFAFQFRYRDKLITRDQIGVLSENIGNIIKNLVHEANAKIKVVSI